MHRFINFFKKNIKAPIFIVFILICVMSLPTAINLRSVGFRSAIVVALGVDVNEEDQIELYSVVNIPSLTENLAENSKAISATGETINDAIANLTTHFGRALRMGLTKFILVSQKLAEKNLADIFDRLVRTYGTRNTVQLIMTKDPVVDVLNIGLEIESKTGLKLSEIINHQQEYSTTNLDSNLDSFYKGYLSTCKISKLNCISLSDKAENGINAENKIENKQQDTNTGSMGENSSSENQGQNNSNKYISNVGELALFYEGKLKQIVPSEVVEGLNWIEGTHLPKRLSVQLKDDDDLNNAKVFFHLVRKDVKFDTFFSKGIPILSASIKISLDTDEITNSDKIVPITQDYIDEEIKNAISNKIRDQVALALNYSKDTKIDLFEFNDIFSLNNHKEYNEFIKGNMTADEFVECVQLNVEVYIRIV